MAYRLTISFFTNSNVNDLKLDYLIHHWI